MSVYTLSGEPDAYTELRDHLCQVVNLTAATLTITASSHNMRTVVIDRAAGTTITLPQATGTGNIYKFFVKTTLTADGVIEVANATDVMAGTLGISTDAAGVVAPTSATSDTITMNGSTTGGLAGSFIEIVDVATGVFSVTGALTSSGAEATPFSAAVA